MKYLDNYFWWHSDEGQNFVYCYLKYKIKFICTVIIVNYSTKKGLKRFKTLIAEPPVVTRGTTITAGYTKFVLERSLNQFKYHQLRTSESCVPGPGTNIQTDRHRPTGKIWQIVILFRLPCLHTCAFGGYFYSTNRHYIFVYLYRYIDNCNNVFSNIT